MAEKINNQAEYVVGNWTKLKKDRKNSQSISRMFLKYVKYYHDRIYEVTI